MPWKRVGKVVYKIKDDGSLEKVPGGTHKNEREAQQHLKALWANVKDAKKK